MLLGVHPDEMHEVFECARCRICFAGALDPGVLSDYYPENYYNPKARPWYSASLRGRLSIGLVRQASRARSATRGLRTGRVLDIGCGRGGFLTAMRSRGWDVVGMDWNASNARTVSESLGLTVVGGEQALAGLEGDSFDLVTMFHVLEHEQEPWSLLERARTLLKPNGRLVVGVPSGDSVARGLFGQYWMGYDVPRHRYVFTPSSLRQLLGDAGFEIERVSGRLSDELVDLEGSIRLRLRPSRWPDGLATIVAALAAPLAGLLSVLGRGSAVYAYARKGTARGVAVPQAAATYTE
jgi:SAM-dependent methyltransferase